MEVSQLEQETLRLINLLRQSPGELLALAHSQGAKQALEVLKTTTPGTRLHLSTGLSCAARDVACYLRTFGFVAAVRPAESPVCAPFLHKYGRVDRGLVLENFAYGFETPLNAIAQIVSGKTPDVNGVGEQLWSPDVHIVGIAAARHSSEQTCLVLILCTSFFDNPSDLDPFEAVPRTASEFFPARIAKQVVKSKAKREGLEGAKKLWDFLDSRYLKVTAFFQTDSSEPLTGHKVRKLLTALQLLSEAQVQWLVESLCKAPDEVINPRALETTMLKLKSMSRRSADCQRALIRLRKFIQETQHSSLIDAFSQMPSEEQNAPGELSVTDVKTALSRMTIQFPVTDVNLIMEALQEGGDGKVTLDTWIKVLCSADIPQEERRSIPKKPSLVSPRGIILSNCPTDARFTPLSATTPRRPLTAPTLKSLSSRPLLKRQPADESVCVSSTHWSESSSIRAAEDLPALLAEPPGTQLVEAGRMLTNTAELGETKTVRREMRALGTHAYSGPGRHHEVLGEIEEGGVVTVLEENGVWAKVQCGMYEGWVPLCKLDEEVGRRLYSRHDGRARVTDAKLTGALSQVYLRKEPDWSSQAIKKMPARQLSGVLCANEQWVKVEIAGQRGWVPRQLTSMTSRSEVSREQVQSFWTPKEDKKQDLFEDYDRLTKSFLTPPILPNDRLEAIKSTVSRKMTELEVQHQDALQSRMERIVDRTRTVKNWLKLELSQAFQCCTNSQWKKHASTLSKYDKYTQEQTEEIMKEHKRLKQSIAEKKQHLRLRAVQSASDLRSTLLQQTQSLLSARSEATQRLKQKIAHDKAVTEHSIATQRLNVMMRNSAVARSAKTAQGKRVRLIGCSIKD